MSIFRKTCPACSSSVSSGQDRCDCGHNFDGADDPALNAVRAELAESELMEAYLVARVEQAVSTMDASRAALTARSPGDFAAAAQVLRAVLEARTLRDELEAQREQSLALRSQLETPGAARPSHAFTATQAAKAQQIMARFEGTDTKACPDCGITLPLASALCLCGHVFGDATGIAAALPDKSGRAPGTTQQPAAPRA